jgi:multiple sugar transport system ATP-binding protein
MADIAFNDVTKVYPDGSCAVDAIDLEIRNGEFMVFVGPSGCGKTTALRMVAGLEEITSGTITIDDDIVNTMPVKQRDVAMVFQNYALYPHMTVAQNLGFGLKVRKLKKNEIKPRVEEVARVLGIEEFLERKPRALSGGQRQRVAMGRAIIREPRAFLMDEPLSNLDAKLRVQMRAEIARIQRQLGVTTIYVTHDQTEAMTMGDRVVVMRKGRIQQVASPDELYERPTNLFVAGFIGSPPMNLVEATITRETGPVIARFAQHDIALDAPILSRHPTLANYAGRQVIVGIRPESIEDASLGAIRNPAAILRVTVELREALGSDVLAHFRLDAPPVKTEDTRELSEDAGPATLGLGPERANVLFVARLNARSRVREGEPAELHVDSQGLHFFDPETGASL